MAGYRDKIIIGLSKGINIIPFKLFQKAANQSVILPFYHTISDEDLPHIKHLYPLKSVKAFINDLDFILKHYTPIDYIDFQNLTRENKQAKKPSFLLSFDDGLREFHDIIAPILLKKGIPAICFLNSGFIDNNKLFFRYKSSLLIDNYISNTYAKEKLAAYFNGEDNVIQKILTIKYQDQTILDELADLIQYSFDDFLATNAPYLSSKQINSLIKKGFHFGAHSIDHPEFRHIKLDEQIRQTKESMQFVCNNFALDYKAFSFPFTDFNVSKKFFTEINSANTTDITFGCAGQKKDCIPNNYQRIPLEMAQLSAKQILKSELFYFLLKKPLGKNTLYRND